MQRDAQKYLYDALRACEAIKELQKKQSLPTIQVIYCCVRPWSGSSRYLEKPSVALMQWRRTIGSNAPK